MLWPMSSLTRSWPSKRRRPPNRLAVPERLMMFVRSFSTTSRPALRAAACGGRPRAGNHTTVAVKPAHPAASWSTVGRATRSSDSGGVWTGSNPRGRPGANQLRCQLPMRSHVSWRAGQVVGGRRPWPRAACGGPAGCWLRCRQHDGGGPELQARVRQGAGRAMLRAGRWLGRACGPGGSGSNHPGREAGSRPWRPSWVAVRVGGQAGAEVGGNFDAPARAATRSASCRVESTCG